MVADFPDQTPALILFYVARNTSVGRHLPDPRIHHSVTTSQLPLACLSVFGLVRLRLLRRTRNNLDDLQTLLLTEKIILTLQSSLRPFSRAPNQNYIEVYNVDIMKLTYKKINLNYIFVCLTISYVWSYLY